MTSSDIKKLAQFTATQGKIEKKLAAFILRLKRRELIEFTRQLNRLIDKNTVKVISELPLTSNIKQALVQKYSDKKVHFIQEKIGDGIKVIVNDTISDLTVEGFVDQTIGQLKTSVQ